MNIIDMINTIKTGEMLERTITETYFKEFQKLLFAMLMNTIKAKNYYKLTYEDKEDIVYETIVKFLEKGIYNLKGDNAKSVYGYLKKMIFTEIINVIRKNNKNNEIISMDEKDYNQFLEQVPDITSEEKYYKELIENELDDCIGKLPRDNEINMPLIMTQIKNGTKQIAISRKLNMDKMKVNRCKNIAISLIKECLENKGFNKEIIY